MRAFLIFMAAIPLYAGLQLEKSVTVKKESGVEKDTARLFLDADRAKVVSDHRHGALYYFGPSFFACVPQVDKGTCFKKQGNLMIGSLQTGLPLEGLVRYKSFRLTALNERKNVSGLPCQNYRFAYELTLNVSGLEVGKAEGKSVGCFSKHERLMTVLTTFQTKERSLAGFAEREATTDLKKALDLGYPLELNDDIILHILGKSKAESFLRHEVTEKISDWKPEPKDFDLPKDYPVVDISNLTKNLGSLLKLIPK